MRRLGVLAVAVGLAAAAFVAGATAPPRLDVTAAGRPEVKLGQKTGYVNIPRLMKDYRRAGEAAARLNARWVRMSGNLVGLRAMYLDLQVRAQKAAEPKERDRVAREMLTVARQIEDLDRELNKALKDRASQIIAELYREIRATIAEMAREHGLSVVHGHPGNPNTENPAEMELLLKPTAAHPLYLDPSADYTDELIRRLNDKLDAEDDRR